MYKYIIHYTEWAFLTIKIQPTYKLYNIQMAVKTTVAKSLSRRKRLKKGVNPCYFFSPNALFNVRITISFFFRLFSTVFYP